MELFPFFSYISRRLRYPEFSDYLNEGYGIEARCRRSEPFWKKHLELSRQFQETALKGKDYRRVAVFGAGRLLDVNQQALLESTREIHLFDADPGVMPAWKKFAASAKKYGARVEFHLSDISGQVLGWTSCLKSFLEKPSTTLQKACSFIEALPENFPQASHGETYDAAISLNLLSQIPVHWRERAQKLLYKKGLIKSMEESDLTGHLKDALDKTSSALQLGHIKLLSQCTGSLSVIIFDIFFHYYQSQTASWLTENSLYFPSPFENGVFRPRACEHFDSWLWHVAPQGIEQPEYGVIHEVRAAAGGPDFLKEMPFDSGQRPPLMVSPE